MQRLVPRARTSKVAQSDMPLHVTGRLHGFSRSPLRATYSSIDNSLKRSPYTRSFVRRAGDADITLLRTTCAGKGAHGIPGSYARRTLNSEHVGLRLESCCPSNREAIIEMIEEHLDEATVVNCVD